MYFVNVHLSKQKKNISNMCDENQINSWSIAEPSILKK
jgi:hypothetical protein